jgi:hypothetical protein
MAKKNIYNNLINPQIKPEELDVSMFDDKKELDLSMFDDVVKKKGDSGSTSEVQESASKDTTVDGIAQDGFRKIDTKAIKVQTPIETMEFESNKEPYSSFEYIANKSGSLIKSLVDFGVSYQNQLSLNSPNPVSEAINDVQHQSQQRRTRLEGYDSNKLEDLASFGLGLLLDAPVFAAGGAVGRTASKPLIKTLGLVKQNMLKEGVEQVTAKELTKNLAKKYAANVIQSTASSATALGSYEGLMNVKDQIESGVDLEDVEWSESLKATGHGSLIGSSLGPLAPTFGLANKYLNNIMSKGIGKQAATIGLKAAEIPIEASVFTAVGSSLDKEPMSWESYWDNVLMVGVMKGTGAIQKIKDYSKENAQTYGIEFKPEEAKIAKDKVDVETMEGLDLQPSKIETLLKDKQVPLTAKAKLLWRFAGVRADKLDMSPYDVSISKQGEGATVKVWNKDKELVDLQEFPTWEQADNTAFKVLQQASDLKLWDEARQLTLQQKQKVSDKLGSLQDINEISLIPIFERSPEQQKKVVSFRDAISKVKEEEVKEAEKEASVKEKDSSKGITPPKEDSVRENVKIDPSQEIKQGDVPLNETEKAVQEKPMFTEPEQEVKSEQDILKPTQQDILKPTQGEQAPIVESKEKEAPKEAFQEVKPISEEAKQVAKQKIAQGFDDLMKGLNLMQSAIGEERPDALRAMKQIAEGVYELGAANIQEFVDNIRKYMSEHVSDEASRKIINDFIDKNRSDIETLYNEKSKRRKFAERLMTDEGLSEEVSKGLSEDAKNYIPTSNEVTLKDANAIIDAKGIPESINMVKSGQNGIHPRVRVTLAESLIDSLNKTILDDAQPESIRKKAADDAVDVAEFLTKYGTELGQGVQAFAIWSKLNPQTLIDKITKDIEKHSGKSLTDQQKKELKALVDKVKAAPEGFQKFNATTDLLSYEARMKGIGVGDLAMSVWYSHILSGYKTQQLNFLANTAQTAAELATSLIYHPRQAVRLLSGLVDGYGRGLLEAWSVLKTGYNPLKESKFEFTKSQAKPPVLESYQGFKALGGQWNPLKFHKYVGRIMNATDTFFFYGLKGMRLQELLHRQTQGFGMSEQEATDYINKNLLKSGEGRKNAIKQAKAEGLTGINLRRRVLEIMEQSLPNQLYDDINSFAARGTFNYQPEGRIGKLTDGVAHIVNNIEIAGTKPLKFIVPFTSILSNVANTYLDFSPYGYVRAYRGQIGGKADLGTQYGRKFTPEDRAKEIIKASIGTLSAMAVMTMATTEGDDGEPLIEITANGTGDFVKNYNLQETGWQKYSIKYNGKWHSYQNTPLAVPFTIIGNVMDFQKYRGEPVTIKTLERVLFNTALYFQDMTFLKGISEFLGSFSQAEATKDKGYFSKYLTNLAKGFVVPNIVTQTSRLIQEQFELPMKEANDAWEQMYRDIPIARNDLNDMINGLGETVVPNMNRWVNKETHDPIWSLIVENNAWISKPSKDVLVYGEDGKARKLTNQEYYDYAKLRGQKLKKSIEDNLVYLQGLGKEDVQEEISRYKEQAGDDARWELQLGKYSKGYSKTNK